MVSNRFSSLSELGRDTANIDIAGHKLAAVCYNVLEQHFVESDLLGFSNRDICRK